ncbi:hypothetical protein R1flu_006383 [Riccia fluitans]|uniref:Protein kinase domain-containing protein n=1 Tax=Riccia fluitans TaxID=41844 RepID=A0ABD1YWX0_9MARC
MAAGQAPPDFVHVKVLQRSEDLSQHYTLHDPLGRGLYGSTMVATPANDPTSRFALKRQEKANYFYEIDPDGEILRFFKEIVIVNRILPKHPNIIEIKDVLVAPDDIFIVQELCARDMPTFYSQCDDASASRAFGQLVEAVNLCHEHGITHNDIKADNILFLDPNFMQLKLIDFGIADYRPEWAVKRYNDFDPSQWFSEEELPPISDGEIEPFNDIIALGKILHGMLSGQDIPFLGSGIIEDMQTTFRPRFEQFSPAALHLLSRIGPAPFGPDPDEDDDYWTLDRIRQHPWLTGEPFIHHEPVINLNEQFALLQYDMTVVKRLLKGWMVLPMKDLTKGRTMAYKFTDWLHRGDEQTKIQLVMAKRSDVHRAMKVLKGRMRGSSAQGVHETIPPLRIYLDMLITLRILPRHDNLVKIRDIYVDKQSISIIKELLDPYTLEDFFPLATDVSSRRIFKQITNAVRHLHHHGVVHMDLQIHHIVFTDGDFSHCKIINCSKALYVQQMAHLKHENFEPERYLTRELLEQMAKEAYFQVDISALGMILHAMMCNYWEPDSSLRGELPLPELEKFDHDAFDLLSKIGPEPYGPAQQDRNITIDAVCNHPWIRSSHEPQNNINLSGQSRNVAQEDSSADSILGLLQQGLLPGSSSPPTSD